MSIRHGSLWGTILAGGEGERLKEFVSEQFGSPIPKQFCVFGGRRSMLERTIRRAQLLIPPERLVVVGTAHHAAHLVRHLSESPPGTVLLQPANRDTAPGVLLSLIRVLQKDPHAVTAILPSDHFILPGYRFMQAIAMAASFVESHNLDVPILLAVKPDRAESEYGWIEPGELVEQRGPWGIRQINCFVEKPPADLAKRLLRGGWLWNTMAIVVRAQSLLSQSLRCVPQLAGWFTILQRQLGGPREQDVIEAMYQVIPKVNFSTSVLANPWTRPLALVVHDVFWSDWGTKERILSSAAAFGLRTSPPIRTPHHSLTTAA